MPFLSIVTRHMTSRPTMFARHLESLQAQTDRDFEQVLIIDEAGNGLAWANAQFAVHAGRVTGDYVLLLDDDDVLADPDAVAALRAAVGQPPQPFAVAKGISGGRPAQAISASETWVAGQGAAPDLVIFRCDHGIGLGILPDAQVWQKRPAFGHIGGSSFIVRNEVWQQHIGTFAQPSGGDYHFLEALWRDEYAKAWLDRVLVRCQRVSHGRPE